MIAFSDDVAFLAIGYTVAGLVGAMAPGHLASANAHGVDRWPMAVVAGLFALGWLWTRGLGQGLVFRVLGASLAVAAACMARPGAAELGLPYLPLEWILAPLSLLSLALFVKLPTSTAIKMALGSFGGMAGFVYALSFALEGASAPRLDSFVFASMTIPILMSGVAAWRHRNHGRTE